MRVIFAIFLIIAVGFPVSGHAIGGKPILAPEMVAASLIARQRSLPQTTGYCWRFVKRALLAAGAVSSYPKTNYAHEAGRELVEKHGFTKLKVSNPWKAPVGAVLVYGPNRKFKAGHVEIRGSNDFISDYRGRRPADFKFIGAYALVGSSDKLVLR